MTILAHLLRPLSLRLVILLGFALAILPLVATLAVALRAVDDLADSSQATAYRMAQLGRDSELMRERLVDFERKAKRHLVLDDGDSRAALDEAFRGYTDAVETLAREARGAGLEPRFAEARGGAADVYQRVASRPPAQRAAANGNRPAGAGPRENPGARSGAAAPVPGDRALLDKADELFGELAGRTRALARAVAGTAEAEVRALESRSQAMQQRLLLDSSVWLPISLLMVSLLAFLTLRSLRQMDHAIRRLGAGDLVRPIRVTGPKDLEYLGERLEWLRSRLHGLEEAKQQFIRHVSHELKTPLANIHEGAELLADEVVGELNPEQRDIVQILAGNSQRLDALIAGLINYSQVNAHPAARRREWVDMRTLVESAIDDSQLRLRSKSVTVNALVRPVKVMGNPEQLHTVIDNLLSNAIKYSPQGGEIRLGLRRSGGHMELEVEDDGPGITPEEREEIFEPFYQGRAAKEGGVGGTGLGLAIVSECVAGHHGLVEALTPRPDKTGARIRVQLPLRQDD